MKLAAVYISLVMGAGFASGREITQFFNAYGPFGFHGAIIASALFVAVAYITLRKIRVYKITTLEEYLSHAAGRFAKTANAVMTAFLCGCFCVMLSAGGDLISSALNFPSIAGIWLFAAVCFVVFCFDARGILAVSSALSPIIALGVTGVSLTALANAYPAIAGDYPGAAGGAVLSALSYVGYNALMVPAVFAPLHSIIDKKSGIIAACAGGGVLGILVFLTWFTLNVFFKAVGNADMPLLEVAGIAGARLNQLYGIVLFAAILSTAAANGFSVLSQFKAKSVSARIFLAAALCLTGIPVAAMGFAGLISWVYTAFGYAGIIWIAWQIWDYFKDCSRCRSAYRSRPYQGARPPA